MRYTTLILILFLAACQKESIKPEAPKPTQTDSTEFVIEALHDRGIYSVEHEGKKIRINRQTIDSLRRADNGRMLFWDPPEVVDGDTIYFPDHNKYHLESIEYGTERLYHYSTRHLLGLLGQIGKTTDFGVVWDIDRSGQVGLSDLMLFLNGFGGQPLSGFNLDSCVVEFSGFSSGIECDFNGVATMEQFDFDWEQTDPDLNVYVFRTGGDEPEDYTTPGVYNDERLNSIKVELPIGFPGAYYYFRRHY